MSTETLIPVIVDQKVQFLPLAADNTPTYLVVVKREKAHLLSTDDENGDRIYIGAPTVEAAVGWVLMHNPELTYNDILDHMEV